jgi:hypothetical protein
MNSDGDKLYAKLVDFDEIYNFVVHFFSFEVILVRKKDILYPDLWHYSIVWGPRWLQMKKVWTTKL